MSRIQLPNCSKSEEWQWHHNLLIWCHGQIFFDVILFLLSSLVAGSSFMSVSFLVLELWQFSFIRDWSEIWKSEIPSSEFCQISGDWGESGIPYLAWMFLIKCYWMLQNASVTAFFVSKLLMENQDGRGNYPPHTRLGLSLLLGLLRLISTYAHQSLTLLT